MIDQLLDGWDGSYLKMRPTKAHLSSSDTANAARIDDKRYSQRWFFLIKIDHHPDDDAYAVTVLGRYWFSGASEMITLFAQTTQLALADRDAELLFAKDCRWYRSLPPAFYLRTLRLAVTREHNGFAALARKMDTMSCKLLNCKATSTTIWKWMKMIMLALSWVRKSWNNYNITDAGTAYL